MDPRERFSATVEDYRRYRPDYPAALFDWLIEVAALRPGSVVVLDGLPGRRGRFVHHQDLDHDGFLGRVWSSSYVRHGLPDPDGFNLALEDLFQRFQRDGQVRFRYQTEALACRPLDLLPG